MNTWKELLIQPQMEQQYMIDLSEKIKKRRRLNIEVYPFSENVFRAFKETPYNNVKVVLLGQDPYHTPGTADGLAFSSKLDIVPPSLKVIFEEINNDVYKGLERSKFVSPDLTIWARQGVLLINSILTVERGRAGSHKGKLFGWENFTAAAFRQLNLHPNNLVFMFWGKEAKAFRPIITDNRHLILEAAHPAAEFHKINAGFFGCKHFSKTNEFLKSQNLTEINWTTKN
jgi:uracil-DNA glycosylase